MKVAILSGISLFQKCKLILSKGNTTFDINIKLSFSNCFNFLLGKIQKAMNLEPKEFKGTTLKKYTVGIKNGGNSKSCCRLFSTSESSLLDFLF